MATQNVVKATFHYRAIAIEPVYRELIEVAGGQTG